MKNSYIGQAWLVLVLATCFGAALAGVHVALEDRIRRNKIDRTYGEIPKLVRVPGGLGRPPRAAVKDKTQEYLTPDGRVVYKAFDAAGEHIGWVIKGEGDGYADRIELLIGLDAACGKLTGLSVLDQKETPGLGNKIESEKWRKQFREGLSAARPLVVKKGAARADRNEIKAVTGATMSSDSVCEIVNEAVARFRAQLADLRPKQAPRAKEKE